MKNLKHFLVGLVLVLSASVGFAQTILTNTTLSAAVSSSSVQQVVVASATGINAPSVTDSTKATIIYVDREAMFVEGVNSTTLTVIRGYAGTFAAPHASSAFVFVIPENLSTYFNVLPQGSCTRTNEIALPRIHFASGLISDCLGGQWIQGDAYQTQRALFGIGLQFPNPGANAYSGIQTAGTALAAATQIECTEINLPYSMVMTGIGVLNGTAHTDNIWVLLYDSSGKVLATSATAGAASSGDSVYQKLNFTSKYYAVGPARYFGCWGANGTTATVRHMLTGINDTQFAGAVTGQVFGTAANITPPSSFTTAKGPYLEVF